MVKERAVEVLGRVADQAIPERLVNSTDPTTGTYGSYRFTWTINQIFNYNAGRNTQGVGPYANNSGGSPRRVQEFTEPSRTLYALSGRGYEITATNIVNETLTNPTGDSIGAIAYYHRGGRAAVGVFLDGHAEILSFPINPRLTKIKDFN